MWHIILFLGEINGSLNHDANQVYAVRILDI